MKISVDSQLPDLSEMSLPERVEQLRRKMAAVPSRGESVVASVPMTAVPPVSSVPSDPSGGSEGSIPEPRFMKKIRPRRPILPVPPALADLLPDGGLVRGSVVSVSGAGSLMLGIIAAVTAGGGHAAVIGQPRLGLLAATEMGADLRNLALIPDPGTDPVEVAAILLDGLDLVVLGLKGTSVPPSRARSIVARARSKGSTLLVTDGHWVGVELRLDARILGYGGIGSGAELGRGRLTSVMLDVSVQDRASRVQTTRFDLESNRGRIEWVANTDFVPAAELPSVASL